MRNLLICTNRDLASNYFLNLILPDIAPFTRHIFISETVGGKKVLPAELQMLKFFEQTLPNTMLFPLLEAQHRNLEDEYCFTFNELSRKYNIPISPLNDVQSSDSLNMIAALQPDLVLSVRYGKIFKEGFLKIPQHGVINLHSGFLPQYRGVLATFRALLHGDAEIGTTLHYITDGTIDTGGIIGNALVKSDEKGCLLSHILRLYPASAKLVTNAIHAILKGEVLSTEPQTAEGAAYYSFPDAADIAAFLQTGRSFVDPNTYRRFMNANYGV